MTSHAASSEPDRYIVVDLPLRLTAAELTRFTQSSQFAAHVNDGLSPFVEREGSKSLRAARRKAQQLLSMRMRRDELLGSDLFGEPAWDLLLDLFVQHVDNRQTSLTSTALATRAPLSTALRYLNILIDKGLVERASAPHDLRVHYVKLSERGFQKVRNLLSED